ncbi:MAG: MarR family winged helix-turn-helix transcriptional regulator [Acidiferrobacterales bacterium]
MQIKNKRRTQPVTKAEYEMLAAFRYALRQFLRFSENIVAKIGLTPQQHQAMLAVKGYPDRDTATIGELAERLQIKHNSAVGLVDRLVTQRLMVRHPASGDRRSPTGIRLAHGAWGPGAGASYGSTQG